MSRWSVLLGATAAITFLSIGTTGCKNGGGAENFGFFVPPFNLAAINSVIPNSGSILGGNSVTIIGSNFDVGATARIGNTDLINVASPNTFTLTGTIPAGNYTAGPVDVTVITSSQTVTLPGGYAFEDMTFTSITPNNGPITGNVPVIIRGTNFKNVPLNGVTLSGQNGTIIAELQNVVVNATFDQIAAIVPPNLPLGVYNLRVVSTSHGTKDFGAVYTVGTGQSTTMLITDIRSQPGNQSPAHGPLAGGTTVTLTADLTAPAPAGFVGGINVTLLYPNGAVVAGSGVTVSGNFGTLNFITPAAPAGFFGGPVNIRVDSSTQGFATAVNGFNYDPANTTPAINSVSPAVGPQAGGTLITLQGINFRSGALSNVRRVLIGGNAALGLAVQSTSQLQCTTPAGIAGLQPVVVESTTGAVSNAVNFQYLPSLVVNRLNPNNGPVAGSNTVTFSGANFTTATVISGSISIGGKPVTNLSVINSTTVTGIVPKGDEPGPVDVVIQSNGGLLGSILRQGYTYGPAFDENRTPPATTGPYNSTLTATSQGAARAIAQGALFTSLDAVTVNSTDNTVTVTYNVAQLATSSTTTIYSNAMLGGLLNNPVDVKIADVTRDGVLDIVVLNAANGAAGAQSVLVLQNNGNQTFTASGFATNLLPNFNALQAVSIDVLDVNADGRTDIAVLGSSTAAVTNGVAVIVNNTVVPNTLVLNAGVFSPLPAGDVGAIKLQFVNNPDLNGDAFADLVCLSANSATVTALAGTGAGGYSVLSTIGVGGVNPVAFATGDVDESGSVDIVTSNQGSGTVSVVLSNGAGALSLFGVNGVPFIGTTNFRDVVIGDVNYDCRADIVATSFNGTNLALFLGNGDGSFGTPTNYIAESPGLAGTANVLAISKIEGSSGITAILCVDAQTPGSVGSFLTLVPRHSLNVYFGDFNPTPPNPLFTAGTQGVQPQDVTFGDLNGDARLDFVLVNRVSNNVQVFLGDGTGAFTEPFPPIPLKPSSQPEGVLIARVDNTSGAPSVLVACNGLNQIALLRNFGGGSLANPTFINVDGSGPHQVLVEDMNGDGRLDLMTVNQLSNNITLLLGDGLGNFVRATSSPYPVGNGPLAARIDDLNGDNTKDIVTANFASDNVSVLLQTTATATNVTFAASTVSLGGSIPNDTFGGTTPRSTVEPRSIAIGDLNNDGVLDLVTADGFTGTVTILHGKARGRLTLNNASPLIQAGDVLDTFPNFFTVFPTAQAPYRCLVESVVQVAGPGVPGIYNIRNVVGGDPDFGGLNQALAGAFFLNDEMDFFRNGINQGSGGFVLAVNGIRGSGEFYQPTDYECAFNNPTLVGAPPIVFKTGTTPTGVKLFDMNTDGFLDIVVADAFDKKVSIFINQAEANRLQQGTLGGLRQDVYVTFTVLPSRVVCPAGEFSFKAADSIDYGLPSFQAGVNPHNGYPIRSFKAPKVGPGVDVVFFTTVTGNILGFDIGNVTLDCPPSVVIVDDSNRVTVLKCN